VTGVDYGREGETGKEKKQKKVTVPQKTSPVSEVLMYLEVVMMDGPLVQSSLSNLLNCRLSADWRCR
jgi:hypothetical protein